MENVVIVGSGPAGLTAAIYTARASLQPLVVAGLQPGGQLTTTSEIENFPGFEHGIDGRQLMANMQAQAQRVGARFLNGQVNGIERLSDGTFHVKTDAEVLHTKAIIVATGASAIYIDVPDIHKLVGYGVSTCAVCDGFFYRNKKVAVVGGGDSAMEEALYLSKLASEVILIHRSDTFRASRIMLEKVKTNPKIRLVTNAQVTALHSDNTGLTGITVGFKGGASEALNLDGLFIAIGHTPNTGFLKGLVELDPKGYMITQKGTHTAIPGLFAAGDVEDSLYRQAITAAGRGCQAALQCERWLQGVEHH